MGHNLTQVLAKRCSSCVKMGIYSLTAVYNDRTLKLEGPRLSLRSKYPLTCSTSESIRATSCERS